MTMTLRIVLILVCGLTCWYTLRKIRKSQMQIEDSLFWIVLSFGLAGISIFPQIAEGLSGLLGIFSPVNFVFLAVIFLLLMKVFTLTLKYSQLEEKLKRLVQRIAIEEEQRRKTEKNSVKWLLREDSSEKNSTNMSDGGGGFAITQITGSGIYLELIVQKVVRIPAFLTKSVACACQSAFFLLFRFPAYGVRIFIMYFQPGMADIRRLGGTREQNT